MIDAATREFVLGSVSIIAASSNQQRRPHLVRALGCRVDGEQLTIFLAPSQSADLLADIRGNGRIAVVFSRPQTHQTVQLKGRDAQPVPLAAGDHKKIERYLGLMVTEICALGFPPAMPAAMLASTSDDRVAVRFTIAEAYSQTPGPDAGKPLASAA